MKIWKIKFGFKWGKILTSTMPCSWVFITKVTSYFIKNIFSNKMLFLHKIFFRRLWYYERFTKFQSIRWRGWLLAVDGKSRILVNGWQWVATSGVNFTNILQAAFLYKSVLRSLQFRFVTFRQKKIGAKTASKLLVKLTTRGSLWISFPLLWLRMVPESWKSTFSKSNWKLLVIRCSFYS